MFVGKSKQRYSEYEPSNAAPLGCGKAAYTDCQSKYEIKLNLSQLSQVLSFLFKTDIEGERKRPEQVDETNVQ